MEEGKPRLLVFGQPDTTIRQMAGCEGMGLVLGCPSVGITCILLSVELDSLKAQLPH